MLESDRLTVEVAPPEEKTTASEADPQVRGKLELGYAPYVATRNFHTTEDGDSTVSGSLQSVLTQISATPTAVGGILEGTDHALRSDP